MAKQLSVAGFSVVVLEQGGWGKYGREQEYNKDEWLNRNLSDERPLDERPVSPAQHVPQERGSQSRSRHAQLRLRSRVAARLRTAGAAGGTFRYEFKEASSDPTILRAPAWRIGPIAYEEIEPYYTQAEWEMGISGLRCKFAVRRADDEGLSGPAGAAEKLGRVVQHRGSKNWD